MRERDHPNSLWQGDALAGPWLPDPEVPGKKRRAHLFAFTGALHRMCR